ncbi:MAG: NAD-dependent epimerase/dehydratase family protein [Myxococcales bacterium]|nr:NAD-dependent epimerase/dehydratase family protein [Myxococcales bacterium]
MTRHLVTGATGFLGRHLCASLLGAGHEVVALCRRPDPALEAAGVTVRLGDVCSPAAMRAAVTGCEGVFHCAGKVSRDPADAEALYRVHVDGTKTTLDAARAAGVRRVVIASTSGIVAVSDDAAEVRDEDAPTPQRIIGRWPYYRSKLHAERAAFDRAAPGFEVVAVNPSLLLGPGDLHGSSTEDVRLFLERKLPFVPAGGIAFVDARDAATAMASAMERGRPGQRYLVNAANWSLGELFARLGRLSGVRPPLVRLPRTSPLVAGLGMDLFARAARALGLEAPVDRASAEMAQFYWYADASRARAELGFSPRDPDDTLRDTIDDLRARGAVWPRLLRR